MIITLYLSTKLLKFRLPNTVSGSFSFDYDEDSPSKLVNVEARDGKWILYSTSDVIISNNNTEYKELELQVNQFYVLKRDEKIYLIFVNEIKNQNTMMFQYDKLNLTIGNNPECNISYDCPYLKDVIVKISTTESGLVVEKNKNIPLYANEIMLREAKNEVSNDCQIELYGLKIMIINKIILITDIQGMLHINVANSGMAQFQLLAPEEPKEVDIKDIDLYSKEDYYSKSPRMRRLIETKEVKLTAPPSKEGDDELPLILTIGPMLTMSVMSIMTIITTISKISEKKATVGESLPQIITCVFMIISTILWPVITNKYNKIRKARKQKQLVEKYDVYLNTKSKELDEEVRSQSIILNENLIPIEDCLNIIKRKNINFWDKRIDQSDFLTVRIGVGNEKLDANISYEEEDFSIDENELRKKADELKKKYEYIPNVPIGYSFYDNITTAVMGENKKTVNFMNNVILQLLTFYTYEELKIVVFTSRERESYWDYLKYLNHTFSNDRNIRFFSTNQDSAKIVSDYLNFEINNRKNIAQVMKEPEYDSQFFIIVDGYDNVKKYNFVDEITEFDGNLGMNLVFIENKLSKLPSKCSNFIMLGENTSSLLKNSYEQQEKMDFQDEIRYGLDMYEITSELSNIPIEFADGVKELPNSITFLEMEKVSKVEQLNVLNRWNSNDSTESLRAEVGVDERGDLMYLDLHEKYHGPHGLIAGMTGSGKSEFIITYILSMCINYSPDDVAFILIDYKGGGLAFAFENKTNNIILPHLAGTITNLDKAEMDRTLVSIDSEIKRRQEKFNIARDKFGESTIDIYKYQRLYKEGKLDEAIPHLFIICDEFAELKSQQPDFMENLISVARIGRSLGVHLILATQKPSGVVNDQIWSNTKFRVCLKVQDESDSKEMLKRPEAASLKQTGRFYLQVGFDEYFALGQSGWCGAKYYPSDKIVKQVDKSINFIDDCGNFIKSIQASSGAKNNVQAQGEELSAIMNNIISISKQTDKKARRLWLDNIPPIVLVSDLIKKYDFNPVKYNPVAIIGEYDAPELQKQGLVTYDLLNDGNCIVYGIDGNEREKMINTIMYSLCGLHSSEEVNFYIVDYGSEMTRIFEKMAHVGGITYTGEEEKFNNLIKLIKNEIAERKKLFADYGGEYTSYNKNSGKKLPLYTVIINNFDTLYESNERLYDILPELTRDSERYGIVFILTASGHNSVFNKLAQNFKKMFALKLKDSSDYAMIFDQNTKMEPRDIEGRGLYKEDVLHEFQTSSIVDDMDKLNEYISKFIIEVNNDNKYKAKRIPILPEHVTYEEISEKISDLHNMPLGISRNELEIVTKDFLQNIGTFILTNKVQNACGFVKSLLFNFTKCSNLSLIVFDSFNELKLDTNIYKNYYTNSFDKNLENVFNFVQKKVDSNSTTTGVILIYGFEKFYSKVTDHDLFEKLVKLLKQYEKISLVLVETPIKMRDLTYESWYSGVFDNHEGIWVGKGVGDQNLITLSNVTKEMSMEYKNDMGYIVTEGIGILCKLLDYYSRGEEDEK